MKNNILAYDFGTSGVKAALVDLKGTLIGYEEEGYPLFSEKIGWAEQDPRDFWTAVCKATKTVIEKTGTSKESIASMCFSTQGWCILPVDENGEPTCNCISWVDSRARKQADEINERAGAHIIDASDVIPKMLWIKEEQPDVYEKTKYMLDCNGYLSMRATGVFCMDYTCGVCYATHEDAQQKIYDLFEMAGLDFEKVAPLYAGGDYVGPVTEIAAEELGVPAGTPVYMGVVDTTCAAVGAGCCKEGDAHIYLGTSGWFTGLIHGDYLDDVVHGIYQIPCLDLTKLIYGGCIQSVCLAFNWTIDEFYKKEKESLGGGIFDLIDEEVADIPPGSNGVLASPWLMGERCPIMDEKAKGVFIGISNLTKRSDLVNAMMESICYSLLMQMEYYQHDVGKWPEKLGAIGGGALSDHWLQMMADIADLPIYRPKNCRHAGAIGAAATAAVGMGLYKVDEIDQFVQIEKRFEPIPENVEKYKPLYQTWKKVYPALKEIFSEIN